MSDLPDLVNQKILSYLNVSEIVTIRLVCKSWNSAGTMLLNDRIDQLQVRMEPTRPEFGGILCSMFQDMARSTELEWNNFYLCHVDLQCQLFDLFIDQIGPSIEYLKLNYNDSDVKAKLISSKSLGQLLTTKAPFIEELDIEALPLAIKKRSLFPLALPELELRKLTFTTCQSFLDGSTYSTGFLKSLFHSSPKLVELVIQDEKYSVFPSDDQMTILTSFAKNCKNRPLTLLKLGHVSNRAMNLLGSSSFTLTSLKTFHIKNLPEDYDPKIVQKLLTLMKDTLESLSLSVGYYRLLPFPTMKNLRDLTLRVSCSGSFMAFEAGGMPPRCRFNWGLQFPKLVTLHLVDSGTKYADGFRQEDLFLQDTTPCTTLKNLEIPPELDAETFEQIPRIFPNVVNLIVPVQTDEKIFSVLWTAWPKLEGLVLSSHYFDVSCTMYESSDRETDTSDEEEIDEFGALDHSGSGSDTTDEDVDQTANVNSDENIHDAKAVNNEMQKMDQYVVACKKMKITDSTDADAVGGNYDHENDDQNLGNGDAHAHGGASTQQHDDNDGHAQVAGGNSAQHGGNQDADGNSTGENNGNNPAGKSTEDIPLDEADSNDGGNWSDEDDDTDDEDDEDDEMSGGKEYRRERRDERRRRRCFDSLLTGISKNDLKAMKKGMNSGKRFTETEIDAKRSFPSISNLKCLKHLMIYDGWLSKFACRRARISNLTAELCFSNMKKLKTIYIPDEACKISNICVLGLCMCLDFELNCEAERAVHLVKYEWQMDNMEPHQIKKYIFGN